MQTNYLTFILAAVSQGCGSDTGRARIQFPIEVGARNLDGQTNDFGYAITLEEAKLRVGGVAFFEGEPLFATFVRELLSVRSAHAHPGHYQEGSALADLLEGHTFDLLSSHPIIMGTATGVTGSYNSAQVDLQTTGELGGHTVVVTGTASQGANSFGFSAQLDLDDSVRGIAFGQPMDDGNGRVRLEIDLSEWFRRVDFSTVSPGDELDPGTPSHNALSRGITNTSAYVFSWVEG